MCLNFIPLLFSNCLSLARQETKLPIISLKENQLSGKSKTQTIEPMMKAPQPIQDIEPNTVNFNQTKWPTAAAIIRLYINVTKVIFLHTFLPLLDCNSPMPSFPFQKLRLKRDANCPRNLLQPVCHITKAPSFSTVLLSAIFFIIVAAINLSSSELGFSSFSFSFLT